MSLLFRIRAATPHHARQYAIKLDRSGSTLQRERFLAQAVRRFPTCGRLWSMYGLVLLERGKVGESRSALVEARRFPETEPWALISRAHVLIALNEYDAADRDLAAALQAAPKDREVAGHVLHLRGKAASRRGLPEAEALLREAVELCPDDIHCWVGLALELFRAGRPDEGIDVLARAGEEGFDPDLIARHRRELQADFASTDKGLRNRSVETSQA